MVESCGEEDEGCYDYEAYEPEYIPAVNCEDGLLLPLWPGTDELSQSGQRRSLLPYLALSLPWGCYISKQVDGIHGDHDITDEESLRT